LADGEDGRLLVHCFGGCRYDEVMSALVEYGLLDDDDGDAPRPVAVRQCDDDDRRRSKIEHGRQIYRSGVQDERIGVYLRSRWIRLTSPVLRFVEEAPHRLGARLPAMLAPIVDVAGEQIGVHMTYLRSDGAGKIDLPKEFQRECRSLIRGGAIQLIPADFHTELIVSESVESGLSAADIFGLPVWSAVYAGGLKTVELPAEVRSIVIAADNDASGAGQRNALAAYDRWTAEGRSVRIKCPPDVGDDFNDVLRRRRSDAWR
jgi:hypothetical protein